MSEAQTTLLATLGALCLLALLGLLAVALCGVQSVCEARFQREWLRKRNKHRAKCGLPKLTNYPK